MIFSCWGDLGPVMPVPAVVISAGVRSVETVQVPAAVGVYPKYVMGMVHERDVPLTLSIEAVHVPPEIAALPEQMMKQATVELIVPPVMVRLVG